MSTVPVGLVSSVRQKLKTAGLCNNAILENGSTFHTSHLNPVFTVTTADLSSSSTCRHVPHGLQEPSNPCQCMVRVHHEGLDRHSFLLAGTGMQPPRISDSTLCAGFITRSVRFSSSLAEEKSGRANSLPFRSLSPHLTPLYSQTWKYLFLIQYSSPLGPFRQSQKSYDTILEGTDNQRRGISMAGV